MTKSSTSRGHVSGEPGHEFEYTVHLPGAIHDNPVSHLISRSLAEVLPEWNVYNLSTRIEIFHRTDFGRRDDQVAIPTVEKVLDSRALVDE